MKKIFALSMTMFLLVGCGSNIKNKEWNENERNIIKNHFYDIELPHPDVKDLNELSFDSDRTAYILGGESNKETLDAYARKFSNEWNITKYYKGGYYYYFGEIELNLNVGKRYVCTQFYNVDEKQEITTEPTGDFFATYYDPYYYSWPINYVNELLEKTEETVTIPQTLASRYGVNDMFMGLGLLGIYCYGIDSTIKTNYTNSLINNSFTYKGLDDRGYDVYLSKGETVNASLKYEEGKQRFTIMLSVSEPPIKKWPTENITQLVNDIFNSDEIIPAFNNADSYEVTDKYLKDYGCLSVFCYTENNQSSSQYGEILKNASWTTEGIEDEDGYIEYISPNKTLSLDTAYNESSKCLDIYIYEQSDSSSIQYTCPIDKRAAYGLGVDRTDNTIYFGREREKVFDLKFTFNRLGDPDTLYLFFDTSSSIFKGFNLYFEIVICDKQGNDLASYGDKVWCFKEGQHYCSFNKNDFIWGENPNIINDFIDDYKNTGAQNYQVYLKFLTISN